MKKDKEQLEMEVKALLDTYSIPDFDYNQPFDASKKISQKLSYLLSYWGDNEMREFVEHFDSPNKEPVELIQFLRACKGSNIEMKSIVTNPIILGIAVGMIWSLLKIPQPVILSKSVTYLGNMATPLSLIALGASFKFGEAKGKLPVTLGIAALKLVLFCAVFLPIAVKLGFRGEKLIAILVMLGSATTGSCFVMAKNLGHKGTITAFAVMLTTLLSAFTLTGWLFVLKTLGYI